MSRLLTHLALRQARRRLERSVIGAQVVKELIRPVSTAKDARKSALYLTDGEDSKEPGSSSAGPVTLGLINYVEVRPARARPRCLPALGRAAAMSR
jgi:hypothetical protein